MAKSPKKSDKKWQKGYLIDYQILAFSRFCHFWPPGGYPKMTHFWPTFWTHFWTTFWAGPSDFNAASVSKMEKKGSKNDPTFWPKNGQKMTHFLTPQHVKFDVLTPKCQVLGVPRTSGHPKWPILGHFLDPFLHPLFMLYPNMHANDA